MPAPNRSIAVVGAGAIGGLVAAELRAAGHAVTLCVRRPIERLVVTRDRDPRDLAVGAEHGLIAATSPDDVDTVRWAIVTLKGQDSEAAAPWLASLVGPDTVVVAIQNGVEHRERLGPHVHGAPLVPALIDTAVERTAPGKLVHRAGHTIALDDQGGADRFAALFAGSTLDVRVEPDFLTAAWRKLLSNVAANPITTLTNRRMEVFGEPAIRRLALELLEEAVRVGRAEGAALTDDEPERTLAAYDELPPDGGSSMLYDRLAGRPLEAEPLTGAVVRAAERHRLPAPRNRTILALLTALGDAASTPPPTERYRRRRPRGPSTR